LQLPQRLLARHPRPRRLLPALRQARRHLPPQLKILLNLPAINRWWARMLLMPHNPISRRLQ